MLRKELLAGFLFLLTSAPLLKASEVWYVSSSATDGGDGKSLDNAFKNIQQAADCVNPGDTVIIGSGVYFENVQIRAKGKVDKPITFKADKIENSRVIISGADAEIRTGKNKWTLEDKQLGLYSIKWSKPRPTRVLYSNVDLYPYKSFDVLRTFCPTLNPKTLKPLAGPQHGYFWDEKSKKIYVRLHASGKYGDTDPNKHVMCVSGPMGGGVVGLEINEQSQYNIGILGKGDANVVIEGITCETPGVTGIYTEANNVRVRDCWFYGCRSGASGTAPYMRPENFNYDDTANQITVERCYWTQFPCYEDGLETLSMGSHCWQRKDTNGGLPDSLLNYEVGITSLMGQNWIVRNCHVESAFDGMSSRSTTNSNNVSVHDNIFEKLLDNAVESEDHAKNLHVYRNIFRDSFVPLSWQPLEGKPWPGPVYFYQNVIYNTPEHIKAFAFRYCPIFKIGATNAFKRYGKGYVPEVANPGIVFANNTIFWPKGCMFWGALWGNNPDKISFYNNIILTEMGIPANWKGRANGLDLVFFNNLIVETGKPGFARMMMSEEQVLPEESLLKLEDIAQAKFKPLQGSPAIGKTFPVLGINAVLTDIGAIQQGDTWYPPQTGPQTSRLEREEKRQ